VAPVPPPPTLITRTPFFRIGEYDPSLCIRRCAQSSNLTPWTAMPPNSCLPLPWSAQLPWCLAELSLPNHHGWFGRYPNNRSTTTRTSAPTPALSEHRGSRSTYYPRCLYIGTWLPFFDVVQHHCCLPCHVFTHTILLFFPSPTSYLSLPKSISPAFVVPMCM
jgi:hypothetical protein